MRPLLNPITRKRLRAFRHMKRAHASFWLLALLYGLSLIANLLLNDVPLYVRYNGDSYFPVLRYYPESTFTGGDRQTRPDYKALNRSALFADNDAHFMVFPPVPFGPNEIIPPESIDIPDVVTVRIERKQHIGNVNITPEGTIARASAAAALFGFEQDRDLRGVPLGDLIVLPQAIEAAVVGRFENRERPEVEARVTTADGTRLDVSLTRFAARSRPPATVRLTVRELADPQAMAVTMAVGPDGTIVDPPAIWGRLSESQQTRVSDLAASRFVAAVQPDTLSVDGVAYTFAFDREDITYPFRPVRGHPFGLDSSGRDVLVQIVYATRISMSFGFVLVISTMIIGILVGAMQGYYGGAIDVVGQRIIEIWSALPFLYVMILLGSVYGRSFGLLLICYGMFNWIGISYYIRAEFLKLRSQPFVEAASVLGLPQRKIIFRHVLPNGLVPVITFFPFSLVGAIGSLAALDYLGFGLPPPTPSWGALLSQGQEFRFAWWLVLFPSVTLFIVILLGVFIGEGVRAAFDPRHDARME